MVISQTSYKMLNCSRMNGGTSCHALFHRNMLTLMAFNKTPPELKARYREGMFTVPNKDGFTHVSHFLLNLIYPQTKAFRNCWPIFEKSQDRAFRQAVFELLRGLNADFGDILQFPDVLSSQLMSPGGDQFIKWMWKLSTLALAVLARRESGCDFLRQPTGKQPAHIREVSAHLRRCSMLKDYEEVEQTIQNLESMQETFEKSKKKALDKMMKDTEEIKAQQISMNELLKEARVDDDLSKKLMDLSTKEGESLMGQKIAEKKEVLKEAYGRWKECAEMAEACNNVVRVAIEGGGKKHKIVLDASDMICHPQDSLIGKGSIHDEVSSSGPVSLVKNLALLRDRLRSIKLDCQLANDRSESMEEEWEAMCDGEMQLAKEMKSQELELEEKLQELTSNANNGMENNTFMTEASGGEIKKQPLQSTPISNPVACASTPVKGASLSTSQNLAVGGAMNVTPYQLPSNENYFSDKMALAQKNISDKTREAKEGQTMHENPVIVIDEPKPDHDSSLGAILERFRKVQESMKSSCNAEKNDDWQ